MKIRIYIYEYFDDDDGKMNQTTTVIGKEKAKSEIASYCEQLVESEYMTEEEAEAIVNEFEENDEIDVTSGHERIHYYFDRIIDTDEL